MPTLHRPLILTLALVGLSAALADDFGHQRTQLEKYLERDARSTYQLDVPGKDPITIIEADDEPAPARWVDVSLNPRKDRAPTTPKDEDRLFPDVTVDYSRCFGPSCREGDYESGSDVSPTDNLEEFLLEYADRMQGVDGNAKERLQAISSLASKLKRNKNKANRYGNNDDVDNSDDNSFPYSTWNRLKVKQHKHPYDDRDGWVTMEAVPYSTSKVSKWKPNSNRHRPNHWDDEESPDGDRFASSSSQEDFRKPTKRPAFVNNRPHFNTDWNETPSKPTWTQQTSYPAAWSPDESRRPHRPNCDSDSHRYPESDAAAVYYGVSDSVVTDGRPADFPHEYQALKRPQRPTQVVYADFAEERPRPSHPASGDGQWVLLSTTKGYHHSKKRPRSMSAEEPATITSHRAVALTVLPQEGGGNTTTSHGGLLEVERSFKSVDESKRDSERGGTVVEPDAAASQEESPAHGLTKRKRVLRRRLMTAGGTAAPVDSSAVLAAVGAGMLPATMAMVVPMMLGKRRRKRDLRRPTDQLPRLFFRYK